MTRKELARTLRVGELYLQKKWAHIVEQKAKQGIELCKCGRGDDANYGIRFPWQKSLVFEYGLTKIQDITNIDKKTYMDFVKICTLKNNDL